jgi:beta-aspartyl-dipeptidase (metallo-type)
MLRFLRAMHQPPPRWPLERILPLMTSNPAAILQMPGKGRLQPGCDADILLLDAATLELKYVLAKGEVVKTPEWVRGGFFEQGPGIRPRRPT